MTGGGVGAESPFLSRKNALGAGPHSEGVAELLWANDAELYWRFEQVDRRCWKHSTDSDAIERQIRAISKQIPAAMRGGGRSSRRTGQILGVPSSRVDAMRMIQDHCPEKGIAMLRAGSINLNQAVQLSRVERDAKQMVAGRTASKSLVALLIEFVRAPRYHENGRYQVTFAPEQVQVLREQGGFLRQAGILGEAEYQALLKVLPDPKQWFLGGLSMSITREAPNAP